MHVGVVGAGIMGRLMAWQLVQSGHSVSLFDQDVIQKHSSNGVSAAYTAAGMISPLSEADSAEPEIVALGLQGLKLWPELAQQLAVDIDFRQNGSLIMAHPNDRADLINFRRHLSRHFTQHPELEENYIDVDQAGLQTLELDLSQRFNEAIYIPTEAWLSPQKLLSVLADQLLQMGASLYDSTPIDSIAPYIVRTQDKSYDFDWVIDCRGLGAKPDLKQLRGVRGEAILLHAPDVDIQHLVRFMHPRYRIYIVPRADHHYVIGATQIESDSMASLTVRSALELLSAAYSVHPGFGEANIVHSRVNCRPALPDNLPTIMNRPGLMRINGLFRHGILLAPALAHEAMHQLHHKSASPFAQQYGIVQLDEALLANGQL